MYRIGHSTFNLRLCALLRLSTHTYGRRCKKQRQNLSRMMHSKIIRLMLPRQMIKDLSVSMLTFEHDSLPGR